MSHKNIENAASDRFPNSDLCRIGFVAGAEWQREQDALRGPRSVSGVGDAPAATVIRLLSSIENCLIELAGGPGIGRIVGWLERIDKDLYHVTTRQESIDIEQRRIMSEILDLMRPKNDFDGEKGCPENPDNPAALDRHEMAARLLADPANVGVDMAEKPSTAHYAIFGGTGMHEVSEPVYRIVCELIAERESLSNDVEHLRRVASDRGKLLMRMNEEIDRIMD